MSSELNLDRMRMSKPGALLLSMFAAFALSACGNKQSSTTTEEPPATQTEVPQQPAGAAPAMTGNAAAPAGEQPAAAAPAETVSETDDGGAEAAPEAPASTVQPSLRLGGPASTAPTSSQFKEGTNYTKLVPAQPTSVAPGKVEVVEVFWYGCGHCFALDPVIEAWRAKGKPANVEFVRVPAMWNDATRMHARVFFTAELLGKLDRMHTPIFQEINVKGNGLDTVDKIAALFRANGVSNDDFQKAFASFAVENKLQRAELLNRRYRIDFVPQMIVNGTYKSDVGSAGGESQLLTLINELAAHTSG